MSRPKKNKSRPSRQQQRKTDAEKGTKKAAAAAKKAQASAKPASAPKSEKAQQRQVEQAKAARRTSLRRTGRTVLIFIVVFLLVLAFTAWRNRDRGPVAALGEAYEQARSQDVACGAEAPDPAQRMDFETPNDMGLTGPVTATVVTSCGDLVLKLDPELAPQSVNSFVFLAEEGFFDGTVVYAVQPELKIEAGDQTAMGDQGPGYRINDEPPPDDFVYERGAVALAAGGGPNRSDSRFLIVLSDGVPLTDLNVIGKLADGEAVLDEIAAIDLGLQITGARTRPLETVYIESVTIER